MAEKFEAIISQAQYVEASAWSTIDQASPSALDVNSTTLHATSDTNNSYDGTANKRILLEFSTPLKANQTYEIMPWDTVGVGIVSWLMAFTGSLALGAGNVITAGYSLRVRPILAAYPIAGVSWNVFVASPPTMGAEQTYTGSGGVSFNSSAAAVLSSSPSCSGLASAPIIKISNALPMYGFVIDIKPTSTISGGSLARSSISASIDAPVPLTSARHAYALKMAS